MAKFRPRNSRAAAGLKAISRRDHQMHLVAAAALRCLGVMSAAFILVVNPHHRGGLIPRRRQDWDAFIRPIIEDGTFKTRFRMDHKEFKTLYEMLRRRLDCDEKKGRGRNGTVKGEWILASTLQWLAGHGVSAGADGPRMARSTAYDKIERGLSAINDCGRLRIKWPRSRRELYQKAMGFRARSSQRDPVLKHCVGAVDGLLVRRMKPSINEHPCPDRFFSGHKMTVGMNYQVLLFWTAAVKVVASWNVEN